MQENKTYELIIIGGGPAGAAAAVYAGRKKIDTLVLKKEWGGQSVVSPDIHNWIGTKSISGDMLANSLKEHVENFASDLLKIENEEVSSIERENISPLLKGADTSVASAGGFRVQTKSGKSYLTKTILITTGSNRKQLEVSGAAKLEHKGLTYCASCDGLFFANLDVVVVGAGNAAFESALQLLAYCKSVTVLIRGDESKVRADPGTYEAVKKDPKAKLLFNCESVEVLGDKKVEGLKIKNNQTNEESVLNVQGIFVEIGQIPNTDIVKNLEGIKIDKIGKIEIDPWTQQTPVKGIWAAGDCTNIRYHQNNIAAGDGVKALEDIYTYIKSN